MLPGEPTERFVQSLATALASQTTHTMLTPAIRAGVDAGVRRLCDKGRVVLASTSADGPAPRPALARLPAQDFIADTQLHDEVFGPAALIVDAADLAEVAQVLEAVGGSLTATLWGVDEPTPAHLALVRTATRLAGRVLFASVPTGVAVCAAQQRGGPWPSSTQPATTCVGWAATDRFLRPVAYQDAPDRLQQRGGQPA